MKIYNINLENKNKIWNWLKSNNIAQRGKFDGSKEKQLIGLIGEFEFHYFLFGCYPPFKNEFDKGVDILYNNKSIDVKTMSRNVNCKDHYVNNFLECQLKYNCDIIVFLSINMKKNTFQICGYIPKKEILEKGILYKKGDIRTRDDKTKFICEENMYEIKNVDLYKF